MIPAYEARALSRLCAGEDTDETCANYALIDRAIAGACLHGQYSAMVRLNCEMVDALRERIVRGGYDWHIENVGHDTYIRLTWHGKSDK